MLFLSCKKNDLEIVYALTFKDTIPTMSLWDLETIYTDSGKIKLKIQAPLVERYSEDVNKKIYFIQGILVHFYNKDGIEESYLSSKYAIYHEEDNLWEASDSVVVVNSEGEILNTELLFWDEKAKRIYSPKFVKITTVSDVIHGEGFEADQSFSTWNIKKMTGTIYQGDQP